jgi:serine/threonine-protein kinase
MVGLKSTVASSAYNESVPAGSVISQSPAAGTTVKRGTTVSLVISKGPPLVTVPNVLDKKVAAATQALQAAGFKVKVNKPPVVILDRVLSQSPAPGSQAPKGSTVTITAI